MRFFSQSILSSCALVLGLGLLACGGNPEATPEASGSASAPKKAPSAVAPKRIDPLVMKTYRADACYFGALSLVQARAAYNGSLAGGEPGEGKIPEFGLDAAPTPPTTDAPAPAPRACVRLPIRSWLRTSGRFLTNVLSAPAMWPQGSKSQVHPSLTPQ